MLHWLRVVLLFTNGRNMERLALRLADTPGLSIAVEFSPPYCICNDVQDVLIVICRVHFVARTEVEDLAPPAVPRAPASEYLAALEPANEYDLLGRGHVETLTVHLLVIQHDDWLQSCRDGMVRIDYPEIFHLVVFPPHEAAARAHHSSENLGLVARMEHDEAHAGQDACLDAIHQLVFDFLVRHVPPPYEDIRIIEEFLREALVFVVQCPHADLKSFLFQVCFYGRVNTVGIHFLHGLVLLFMAKLVPNRDVDGRHI